jgi:hypothetical protein
MVIFFYIVFAIPVAVYANDKKRSGIIWFLLSILISPPLAFLILINYRKCFEKCSQDKNWIDCFGLRDLSGYCYWVVSLFETPP